MRIILAGMSNMLTSIITAALGQAPEIIIAGVAGERDDLAARVAATQADAVVMQMAEPGDFAQFRPLLLGFPLLKVIGITSDGKSGFLHELHPRSTRLVEISPTTLLAALQISPVQRTH
jgi:chemotaxis response regulator CheB